MPPESYQPSGSANFGSPGPPEIGGLGVFFGIATAIGAFQTMFYYKGIYGLITTVYLQQKRPKLYSKVGGWNIFIRQFRQVLPLRSMIKYSAGIGTIVAAPLLLMGLVEVYDKRRHKR